MHRMNKSLFVVFVLVSLLPKQAFAEGKPAATLQKQGRTDAIKEALSEDREGKDLIFKNTLEFENTLNKTEVMSDRRACQASLSLDYFEADDHVRIATKLDNSSCEASSGLYQIEIKTIDENGKIERETYSEEWSRLDAQTVLAEHQYPLKDGVELLRAQSKLSTQDACWCDDGLSSESNH